MKTTGIFLAVLLAGSFLLRAADFLSPNTSDKMSPPPTFKGDEHDQPVFTSPTNSPSLPLTTNLPPMPPMTNLPSTNLPPLTNWPADKPPADHS